MHLRIKTIVHYNYDGNYRCNCNYNYRLVINVQMEDFERVIFHCEVQVITSFLTSSNALITRANTKCRFI